MAYFRQWTPPEDPYKPNCPYFQNFTVEIEAHIPPQPFGGRDYSGTKRQMVSSEWLKSATQTEHVLKYPPLQTESLPNPDVAKLAITKSLAIGNSRGAQLAVCSIVPKNPGANSYRAVAKIFDPLYYSCLYENSNQPVDTVRMADQDYSREAAAYEHLRKVNYQGPFTPKYFGSWTFTLPIICEGKTYLRPVRLVLIEYLNGSSMRDLYTRNQPGSDADLDASHYEKEYRLEVLAQILDGAARQRHAGLNQNDLAPRNIILVPPSEEPVPGKPTPLPRVVLIDYNNSYVFEKTKYGKPKFMHSKLPRSPIQSCWNESLPEFAGWIPPRWYGETNYRREWLLLRFGNSAEYEPPQLDDE